MSCIEASGRKPIPSCEESIAPMLIDPGGKILIEARTRANGGQLADLLTIDAALEIVSEMLAKWVNPKWRKQEHCSNHEY